MACVDSRAQGRLAIVHELPETTFTPIADRFLSYAERDRGDMCHGRQMDDSRGRVRQLQLRVGLPLPVRRPYDEWLV